MPRLIRAVLGITLLLPETGCGRPPAPAPPPASAPSAPVVPVTKPTAKSGDDPLPVISLGGKTVPLAPATVPTTDVVRDARQAAITALQPFQTLLGKWRGITNKKVADMSAIDNPDWVWDLRTDKARPALVMQSSDGTYFRRLRMTGAEASDTFRLTATGADGRERQFEGTLAEPVELFQEGGTTVQHKFRLLFNETGDDKDRWQLAIVQQNNDRYLVELSRIRPTGLQRIDTIGHQRQGTSVAKSDTDFGEKKCIISGGLGTISVSYKGKTYWVCCTGCQAAFNEDPESWLRDAAKKSAQ